MARPSLVSTLGVVFTRTVLPGRWLEEHGRRREIVARALTARHTPTVHTRHPPPPHGALTAKTVQCSTCSQCGFCTAGTGCCPVQTVWSTFRFDAWSFLPGR